MSGVKRSGTCQNRRSFINKRVFGDAYLLCQKTTLRSSCPVKNTLNVTHPVFPYRARLGALIEFVTICSRLGLAKKVNLIRLKRRPNSCFICLRWFTRQRRNIYAEINTLSN